MHGLHLVNNGKAGEMRGAAAGSMLVAGALVVRKWLAATESRMAHRLMVTASVGMVLSWIEAASCKGIVMGGG